MTLQRRHGGRALRITNPCFVAEHPPLPRIRAITFDLDDTLWPAMPTFIRAEKRAYDWMTLHTPEVTAMWSIDQLRELRMSIFKAHPELQHDFLRVRRMALHTAFEQAHCSGSSAQQHIEHALALYMTARNEVDLYPEVRDCLTRLSQRFALASLTNGNANVAAIGIDHFFKAVISAHAHGVSKPDPALFHIACRELACAPDEVLHVGDDRDLDIRGARAAGLHQVWMNRTEDVWAGDDAPAVVTNLLELEQWLERSAA